MVPAVSVSRYSLAVDARDTVQAVLDEADAVRGAPLHEALRMATGRGGAAFAAGASRMPGRDHHVRPNRPGRGDPPRVSAPTVDGVLRALEDRGFVSVHNLWSETPGDAYLSEGRTLAAVHVRRPFFLTPTASGCSRPGAAGCADRWEVDGCSRMVGAGWYVVGLVGDLTSELVGVAAVDDDAAPETLTHWAYGVEGFGASYCLAGCGTCGARWRAEGPSWRFGADDDSAAAGFDFDDADGFDNDTITCPACGTGRVGFCVC